jgi:hypothetical protein
MADDRPVVAAATPISPAPSVPMASSPAASVPPVDLGQSAAQAAGPPILALLDFETSTLSRGEVQALSEALWAQINLSGRARLLPREGTRRWLIANDLFPFLPYGPNVPMTRVVRQLHADFLVTGRIDRVQEAYCLEMTIHGGGGEAPIFQDAGARVANLSEMTLSMNTLAGEALDAIERHAGQSWTAQGQPGDWSRMPVQNVQGEERPATLAGQASTLSNGDNPPLKSARPSKTRVKSSGKERLTVKRRRVEKVLIAAKGVSDEPSDEAKALAPAVAIGHPAQTDDTLPATASESISKPAVGAHPSPSPVKEIASTGRKTAPFAPAKSVAVAGPVAAATALHPAEPASGPTSAAVGAPEASLKAQAPTNAAERARQLYKEAFVLDVKNPDRQKKFEEAVELAPGEATCAQQLARDYFQLARYSDCVRFCDKALAISPKDSQLLVIKGSAQISMSRWEDAVKSCRASVAADPGNDFARYDLALALEMMGSGEAVAAWKDFVGHASASADAQIQGLLPDARQRLAAVEKQASKKPATKPAKGQ